MFSIVGSLEGSDRREGPACTAMCLVLDWGNTTSLNPVYIIWEIGVVRVEDLVEVLDSTFVIFTSGFDVTKDALVLLVRPVRELVVSEVEVLGAVGIVVLVYHLVPINESFEAQGELLNVFIDFVEAGNIVGELEVVGTDSGGGRGESGKSERFHLRVVRLGFIND